MKCRLSVIFVSSVLLLVAGCDKDDVSSKGAFPNQTPEHIYLRHAKDDTTSGAIRGVKFLSDGITPVSEVVSLPDGSEKEVFYKPDFKPWRIFEYYAPRGSKNLKSETVFGVDGSFQSHSVFREDKTRKESGRRLLDGTYELLDFGADGVLILKRRVLSKDNIAISTENFDEAGRLVSKAQFSKRGIYDFVETLYFDKDGNAVYRKTKTTDSLYSDTTDVFFPGTMKVRLSFDLRPYGAGGWVRQFNLNGDEVCSWTVGDNKMRVEVRSPSNSQHTAYIQYWVRTDGTVSPDSREWNFELDAVFDQDYRVPEEGSSATWLGRMIEFDPGENLPNQLIIREPYSYSSERTTQYLDRTGKVVKEEIVTRSGDSPEDKTEIRSHDPSIAPDKPIDWNRIKYVPLEVPAYVDFPIIKVRSISH